MKKLLQQSLKFFFPLLLGAGILWYLYKGQDIQKIQKVLDSGIEWEWILLSLVFAILSHVLRAYRWKQQLKTLHKTPSLNELTNSVFGNYGVNLIFPRLGEVWRCNHIARRHKLSFTVVLGTIVSERLFDVLCIGLISVVTLLIQSKFFISFFKEHDTLAGSLKHLFTSPILYGGIALLIILVILFRKKIRQWKIVRKLMEISQKLFEGIKTIQGLPNKWFFIFLTFGIWILYFLNFYVCLYAFDFSKDIGVLGGLTLFVMGSLGIIVPVQGGTGPWHFMIISTMLLLGVGQTEASTFALVVHAIQQGFVILLGLYAMLAINVANRLRKNMQLTV
ncbi:MAG: lysylphosphatidylglycerol synthase transmembrane domain-containing protein [Bacteroidales bacterium]